MSTEPGSVSSGMVQTTNVVPAQDLEKATPDPQVAGKAALDSLTIFGGTPLTGKRLAAALFCIIFGLFISVIETSITATALVSIGVYFHNPVKATWVVLSYLLSYMGFAVIFARLSDGIGRLETTLIAWVFFGCFSLGAGLSKTLNQLIGFRTLQGMGGSGLYSMTFLLGLPVIPRQRLGLFSGLLGIVFALGSVLVLGGVITQHSSWRWIYLFNAPCALIGIVGLLLTFPKHQESKAKSPVSLKRLNEVDFLGAILLLAASALLVFGLQQAGSAVYAWNSPAIITSLTTGGCCAVLFFAWIGWLTYRKSQRLKPILPLSIFITRPVGPTILVVTLTGFPFFIAIILLPQRFQLVNGDTPTMAGIKLLPLLIASAAGSAISGLIRSKKALISETIICASCFTILGCGLFTTIKGGHKVDKAVYGYEVILGLGAGLTWASTTIVANSVGMELRGAAQGAISQGRIVGGSIGLAAATTIFNHELVQQLTGKISPEQLRNVQQALTFIHDLDPSQRAAVVQVLDQSFNKQMRVCLYIAAINVFAAFGTYTKLLKELPPDEQAPKNESPGAKEDNSEQSP